jgi:hypothetical protein
MTRTNPITEELLSQYRGALEVDPTSLSGLRWKAPTARRLKAGDVAGCLRKDLYWYIQLNSRRYPNHRIVWAMTNNTDPGDLDIDHLDGNPSNNHPNNLRLATHAQNMYNQAGQRADNTSGIPGVYWHKVRQKWIAQIRVDGKCLYLGLFACKHEAAKARREAELKYFGEFAPDRVRWAKTL